MVITFVFCYDEVILAIENVGFERWEFVASILEFVVLRCLECQVWG